MSKSRVRWAELRAATQRKLGTRGGILTALENIALFLLDLDGRLRRLETQRKP